ncbi:hypothetical protein THAOC_02029 [Thalassiosira oceanica]|uniref:Uncharacterized protein n=1 Tax=Thalassiosira oceanica TaxID=159749 RepID=K0TQK8_THAOC|nr:hypothetical protein THAOC_02029 [Thalassiosira oceanica]|eukprot:EJK76222.1 hypothetical protein THAOC_02029 [Thalassiosira oceanica]
MKSLRRREITRRSEENRASLSRFPLKIARRSGLARGSGKRDETKPKPLRTTPTHGQAASSRNMGAMGACGRSSLLAAALICLGPAAPASGFPTIGRRRHHSGPPSVGDIPRRRDASGFAPSASAQTANPPAPTGHRRRSWALHANRNDDDDDGGNGTNPLDARLRRADFNEIRRDLVLTACFVLGRYLIYDVSTGPKAEPGFGASDAVYLSGTLSSASVLAAYWTAAGLLTRLFETGRTRDVGTVLLANAVNLAMCVPAWIATEHALRFGPADVGGTTLDGAVAGAFVGLGCFMAAMKVVTADWR